MHIRLQRPSIRKIFSVDTFFMLFAAAVIASHASAGWSQAIRASVSSLSIEPTSLSQWAQELGYQQSELSPLTIGITGCPDIEVVASGVKITVNLDTGTSKGFILTNYAPAIPHTVLTSGKELNPDGSYRGQSTGIRIEAISILGRTFTDAAGTLADWTLFSSEPFNGTVGLDFFLDRRLTLDYRSKKVAVSATLLPSKPDPNRYLTLDLIDPPSSHGHNLYVEARVNGRDSIIHLDTGRNVSLIDPSFAEGLMSVERPGRFKVFRKGVPVELGGNNFILEDLREQPINRGPGFDKPIALELGCDFLSYFVVTIDIRAKKLILARAQ
jgi:hypothetical protein